MSDGPASVPEQNGSLQEGAPTAPPTSTGPQNGAPDQQPSPQLTNGAVTRNKRVCRRKANFKEDYTTKTANQIKSLRLKSPIVTRPARIPKLPPKPCKAGTNVVVKGKVLQEVPEGLLVMSIQWRGKEYCGCFIDSSKQGWALPRFDDPKVSSIAFLTKKAQLLASDVDDSTDDEYSPKTKRKRAAKGRKTKKRKVKNGDTSNGKTVKTPTKPKSSRSSAVDRRRQSTDTQIDKPADLPPSERTSTEKTPSEKPSSDLQKPVPEKLSEKSTKSSEKCVNKTEKPTVPVKSEPSSNHPVPTVSPAKPVEKQSVIVKTESAATPRCIQSPMEPPPPNTTPSPNSVITSQLPKQIRTEKTATIPVGTLSNSLLLKQQTVPKTVNSPFSTITSPAAPINGALVSPLHNHSFPLMVPPPFFIPNFLHSAKFLADGAKRTQPGDSSTTSSVSGSNFSSMFARNPAAVSTATEVSNIMLENQLRNSMT